MQNAFSRVWATALPLSRKARERCLPAPSETARISADWRCANVSCCIEIWEVGPDEIVERAIAASRQAHGATDAADAMSVLRRAKCRMALATAMADIAGIWNVETVTNRLTRFADASVGGALRFLLREAARKMELPELDPEKLEKETGVIILAMGKGGAFELNYSSDLDLIVFYDLERFPFRKKSDARSAAVDLVKGLVGCSGK